LNIRQHYKNRILVNGHGVAAVFAHVLASSVIHTCAKYSQGEVEPRCWEGTYHVVAGRNQPWPLICRLVRQDGNPRFDAAMTAALELLPWLYPIADSILSSTIASQAGGNQSSEHDAL
jgi:hypothetical protein